MTEIPTHYPEDVYGNLGDLVDGPKPKETPSDEPELDSEGDILGHRPKPEYIPEQEA